MRTGTDRCGRLGWLVAAVVAASVASAVDFEHARQAFSQDNTEAVTAAYGEWKKLHGGRDDVLLQEGVFADRRERVVELYAQAIGLEPGKPVEFFLIGPQSGHDYEALLLSYVAPSAVHRALEFIGLPAGEPVSPDSLRFWPKGERVVVSVLTRTGSGGWRVPTGIEQYVLDRRSGQPFAVRDFTFVGSRMLESDAGGGDRAYAADSRDPASIIATYNEPDTVLDVPFRAPQGAYYTDLVLNPSNTLAAGELVRVRLEPEYKDGRRRIADLRWDLRMADAPRAGGDGLTGALTEGAVVHVENGTLNEGLAKITALLEAGREPFVQVLFDKAMTLGHCRKVAQVLASIETDTGIRVEPPAPGQLFFKAFIPDENLRARENRGGQPPELHLAVTNDTLSARVVHVDETWHENQAKPELSTRELPVTGPSDLPAALEQREDKIPVLLVFAPPSVTLAQLSEYLDPVRETHRIVHVYPVPAPADR